MEPITHILFSSALSHAELIPESQNAQIVMVLAGLSPDWDLVFRFKGLPSYFIHHRRESHSFLGLLLLSLPLTALAKFLTPALNLGELYACIWLGMFGHIFLDFLTIYGVPFFFPLQKRFNNFGILFILDPWFALLLLPAVFEKIIPLTPPLPARVSLLLASGYLIFLVLMKILVRRRGKKFFSEKTRDLSQAQLYVSPFFATPFSWLLVLKNQNQIYRMRYSLLFGPGPISSFSGEMQEQLHKLIFKSPLLKALINFSEFIGWQISNHTEGTEVQAWDLRFSQYNLGFRAEVKFNPSGELVSEDFSYY